MRVAITQLEPLASRTAMLQQALHVVDLAADRDPSPDLIVLPSFLEAHHASHPREPWTEHLRGQTCAAIAQRARSWGVFIAYGQAERDRGRLYRTAVLLDPDGDILLAHRQMQFRSPPAMAGVEFSAGQSLRVTDTILGRLALLCGDDIWSESIRNDVRAQTPRLVVSIEFGLSGPDAVDLASVVKGVGTPLAMTTMPRVNGRRGAILNSDGSIAAMMETQGQGMVQARIA